MFVEQTTIKRKTTSPQITWYPPTKQTAPLDDAINRWVDKTGNEIITVSPPSMFMVWLDAEHSIRLIIASVMVTFIPAITQPKPLISDTNISSGNQDAASTDG
jgi:hypothetical protein